MREKITLNEDELTAAFEYLHELRVSGRTNMLLAGRYLTKEYGLESAAVWPVHRAWMGVYDQVTPARDLARRATDLFRKDER